MRYNKKVVGAIAIALVVITMFGGATFAWFTAQDSATNHLETDQWNAGDVKIVEIFDPEPLNPGVTVNKDVWGLNTGTANALIRVSFAEALRKMVDAVNNETGASTPDSLSDIDYRATAWVVGDAATKVPVLRDPTPFTAWTKVTGSGTINLLPITVPAGVTVAYLATTVGSTTKYQFVAYATTPFAGLTEPYDVYNGKYQQVELDIELNDPTTPTAWVVTNPKNPAGGTWAGPFATYTIGTYELQKWASFGAEFPDVNGAAASTSPYFGSTWPVNPVTPPLATAVDISTPATPWAKALVDSPNNYIELLFAPNNIITTLTNSMADLNKWWYNAADGYFYYIGAVGPGQATLPLLDAVRLNANAGNVYQNMKFDLLVKMNAIQALEDMVTSSLAGGWGFASASQFVNTLTTVGAFA